MDLRMMNYLERKMNPNEYRRNEYRAYTVQGNRDYPYEDDDLREPKESPTIGYTVGGRALQRTLTRPQAEVDQSELFEKLQKSLKKELCDVLRYCKMSEMAEMEGHKELAEGLKEMCYEEFTHATFLRGNLYHYGRDPEKDDGEIASMWHKVSHMFETK